MNKTMASTAQPFNFKWFSVIAMVGFCFAILVASIACWGGYPFPSADHNFYCLAGLTPCGISSSVAQEDGFSISIVTFKALCVFMFSVLFPVCPIPFVIMVSVFLSGISFASIFLGAFFTSRAYAITPPSVFIKFRKWLHIMTRCAFFHKSTIQYCAAYVNMPHHEFR